jgi:maltose/moltooligosaccharide transporter
MENTPIREAEGPHSEAAPLKLNYKRTLIIGFAFFGILLLWQVYDSWCPTFLTELFRNAFHPNYSSYSAAEQTAANLDVQYLVGIIMALDNMAALIMLPIFGHISDKTHTKIGKRMPFILTGTIVSAIAFPFIPVFFHNRNMAGVISMMAVVIFFMMMYRNPAVALMPDITPKPLRSKANGLINIMGYVGGAFGTVTGLFFVLSQYLGPKANGTYTWCFNNIWAIEAPFLIASVLMIASALVLFWKIKENKLEKELEPELKRGEELAAVNDSVAEDEDKPMSKANKRMLFLILGAEVLWFFADNAIGTFMGNYVYYYLGCPTSSTMIITIVGGAASVVGFIVAGPIADKVGRKWTIVSGLITYLIGVFIMCFVRPTGVVGANGNTTLPWLLYIVWILKGFGFAMINTCSFPMVVELCSSKKIGRFTGYYYAASMTAQSLTPIVLGIILKVTQVWWVIPIYSTCFIAISLTVFMFVKNIKAHKIENKKGLEALGGDD